MEINVGVREVLPRDNIFTLSKFPQMRDRITNVEFTTVSPTIAKPMLALGFIINGYL
jgi:hypothetical protein